MKEVTFKTVLICNVHSTKNKGDLALLEQTIYYTKLAFNPRRIVILANWFEESRLHQLADLVLASPWYLLGCRSGSSTPLSKIVNYVISKIYLIFYKLNWNVEKIPADWLTLFQEISGADLIIGVSGNQIFSRGRHFWILPTITYPYEVAHDFHKPVLLFPQTIGPLQNRFEKLLLKSTLNSIKKIFLRDSESIELMEEIGIDKARYQYMDDLAFILQDNSLNNDSNEWEQKADRETKNVGFSIISDMGSHIPTSVINNYYTQIAMTIDKLVNTYGYQVFLFSQVTGPMPVEDDNIGIRRVVEKLQISDTSKLHLQDKELDPRELQKQYSQMDVFIAGRLHSGIFSFGARTPTIFIGYLSKTIGILKMINQQNMFFSIENVTCEGLIYKIQDILQDNTKYVAQIDLEMENIKKRLSLFPQNLKEAINENFTNN